MPTNSSPMLRYFGLFLVLITVFLLESPVLRANQILYAQDEDVSYWCTISEAYVRTCPYWYTCDILFFYSPNTVLFVLGTETGDLEAGIDQWLLVEDPVQHIQGYVHSNRARACTPDPWQIKPVVPVISDTVHEIYQRGLELGNDPRSFSKVGDCQNVEAYFMTYFDYPLQYDLGPYQSLQPTIDNFGGSFSRESAAVEGGYTVASALSPLWSDPAICESNETPIVCEARLHNPSIVIISMETWNRTGKQPTSLYEDYLGQVVEFWIGRGVVPILATKADNKEGDGSLNAAIVRVAEQYDIPLWNFWLAAQSLQYHGFNGPINDGFHLQWARSFYNNPDRLRDGWPVRNLTALQAIDAVWRSVAGH